MPTSKPPYYLTCASTSPRGSYASSPREPETQIYKWLSKPRGPPSQSDLGRSSPSIACGGLTRRRAVLSSPPRGRVLEFPQCPRMRVVYLDFMSHERGWVTRVSGSGSVELPHSSSLSRLQLSLGRVVLSRADAVTSSRWCLVIGGGYTINPISLQEALGTAGIASRTSNVQDLGRPEAQVLGLE